MYFFEHSATGQKFPENHCSFLHFGLTFTDMFHATFRGISENSFCTSKCRFPCTKNGFMTESVHFFGKKFGVLQEMSTFAIA